MRWKDIEYPYQYDKDYEKEEFVNKFLKNFEKFKAITGVYKINTFTFGWNIAQVFRGDDPKYNPYSLDKCRVPDHTRCIYNAPRTRKICSRFSLCGYKENI